MTPKSFTIKQFKELIIQKSDLPFKGFVIWKMNVETSKITPFTTKILQSNLNKPLVGILGGYKV